MYDISTLTGPVLIDDISKEVDINQNELIRTKHLKKFSSISQFIKLL